MGAGLRDRLLTPAGARAVTAPSAILLAGAGAAVTIAAGAPLAAAAVVGAAAYADRVVTALPGGRQERMDPRALREPWRSFVAEAQDARSRFQRAVAATATGPLRERLAEIGRRIDDGVRESWRIASRGQALEDALSQLEPPDRLRAQLDQLERERGDRGGDRLAGTVQALRAQLASTERIAAVAGDARDRLRLLDARLDEAVARAVELSLTAGEPSQLGGLGSDVEQLVTEMEALRQALEETSGGRTAV